MAHEVESMFSRTTPWHELGRVTGRNLTAEQALVQSGLDWKVEKQPIYALTSEGFKQVEDKVATVRDKDASVLGVVGSGYEPIQNDKMLEWAEGLVDAGDARFISAGSLREGKVVFTTLEVDAEVELPGHRGQVKPYLTVASSHDASLAFKAFTSPTIVVCMNTLRMAQRNSQSSWTVRHTVSADLRLEQARRMLGLVIGYYDEFTKQAHQMIDQYVTDSEFQRLTDTILPAAKADATQRQKDNVAVARRRLGQVWNGHTLGDFRNTAWGALNAVNEYELWFKNVKGERAERHALRVLNDDFPLTEKAQKILVSN